MFGRLKIRQKLTLSFALIISIQMAVTLFFVLRIIQKQGAEQEKRQIQSLANYQTSLLEEYKNKSRNYVQLFVRDQQIIDAAYIASLTGDTHRLTETLDEIYKAFDLNLLLVTDLEGKILSGRTATLKKESGVLPGNLLQKALRGVLSVEIQMIWKTPVIFAIGPIQKDGETMGTIIAGILLNKDLAEQFKRLSGTEISFVTPSGMIASSLNRRDAEKLEQYLEHDPSVFRSDFTQTMLGKTPYLLKSVPLTRQDHSILGHLLISRNIEGLEKAKGKAWMVLSGILLFSVLVAILIGFFLAGRISEPLIQGVNFAQVIARGDLTRHVVSRGSDEVGALGKALNRMVADLRTLVSGIQKTSQKAVQVTQKTSDLSDQLAEGSEIQSHTTEETFITLRGMGTSIEEVAGNMEKLSSVAKEMSSSILKMTDSISEVSGNAVHLSNTVENTSESVEEMLSSIERIDSNLQALSESTHQTASSLNQINASIQEIEKTTQEAVHLSEQTAADSNEGRTAVMATMEGMEKIRESMDHVAGRLSLLDKYVKEIGKILQVIEDVTEQTNLLSLNAAILASQAGEHGKGFSVVADEIRNLAERTSSSTGEIEELILNIQKEAEATVRAMTLGRKHVRQGVSLSVQAKDALDKISQGAQSTREMISKIANSTVEQASGTRIATEAMENTVSKNREILQAARELSRGSRIIRKSEETIREVASQVSRATSEQSLASSQITQAVEQVMEMITQINQASQQQSHGSSRIIQLMEKIKEITRLNLQRVFDMKEMVNELSEETFHLAEEFRRFQL